MWGGRPGGMARPQVRQGCGVTALSSTFGPCGPDLERVLATHPRGSFVRELWPQLHDA